MKVLAPIKYLEDETELRYRKVMRFVHKIQYIKQFFLPIDNDGFHGEKEFYDKHWYLYICICSFSIKRAEIVCKTAEE